MGELPKCGGSGMVYLLEHLCSRRRLCIRNGERVLLLRKVIKKSQVITDVCDRLREDKHSVRKAYNNVWLDSLWLYLWSIGVKRKSGG